jgi:protein-S-isoprenylcysteine O-methyltransferase Ste14
LGVIALSHPTLTSTLVGLPLILAGCALRTWATGHLVKTEEFTVSGPYAHLRHPLYAGTLLIASGFALAAGWMVAVVALPIFLGLFFAYYFPRKERIEGERLEQLYGEQYRSYRAAVPALLPSLRPWRPAKENVADDRPGPVWHLDRFRDNDELGTLVGVLVALVVLTLIGVA